MCGISLVKSQCCHISVFSKFNGMQAVYLHVIIVSRAWKLVCLICLTRGVVI